MVSNLLRDGLQGKSVIFPKLQILHLSKIHHIKRFRYFLTDELIVLHFCGIYGDENAEKRWMQPDSNPQLFSS